MVAEPRWWVCWWALSVFHLLCLDCQNKPTICVCICVHPLCVCVHVHLCAWLMQKHQCYYFHLFSVQHKPVNQTAIGNEIFHACWVILPLPIHKHTHILLYSTHVTVLFYSVTSSNTFSHMHTLTLAVTHMMYTVTGTLQCNAKVAGHQQAAAKVSSTDN